MREWPAHYSHLNRIKNFWGMMKQAIYYDGTQYCQKEELWIATEIAADNASVSEKKLTETADEKIEMVFGNEDLTYNIIHVFCCLRNFS